MIAVAVVCSAGLQSCLDDNDKYYYVEGFPNALVTVKNATDGSFFLQLNDSTTLLPTNSHPIVYYFHGICSINNVIF